jgi:hypothetical protein
MRRALDTARSELDTLNDRDAILDCYFEQARRLFQFAVLFVVRGDTAHGRNVHGLGAPDGLVARLAFPLSAPGVLSRARELRRPFIGASATGEADAQLFGSLGRVMPAVLVVPLVVRSRVVAIVLGDGPAEVLNQRAQEANRPPVDLAKEEMLLWSESVSEALERVILKKKSTGGSVPPQRPSWGAPRLPAGVSDAPGQFALRAPPSFESLSSGDARGSRGPDAPRARVPSMEPPTSSASFAAVPAAPPPSRRNLALGIAAAGLIAAIGLGAWVTRADPNAERVVVRGDKLAGWPSSVDPMSVLEAARSATGLSGRPELTSIRAEVAAGGRVDFSGPVKNDTATYLTFSFATREGEADVRVDTAGLHAARASGVKRCDREACRAPVPPPTCSFAQIWAAALTVGVLPGDRAFVTYNLDDRAGGAAAPELRISVVDRGAARLDASNCKALARERLRPPPLALAAIPGAPREVAPLGIIDLARTQSGLDADAVLLEVEARGVGSNGLVDLTTGDNRITYTFSEPAAASDKPRLRVVNVDKDGMPLTSADNDQDPRPPRFFSAVTPPPRCSFVHAYRTLGSLPAGATAHITYGPNGATADTGEWKMDVPSQGTSRNISDTECAAWEKLLKKK